MLATINTTQETYTGSAPAPQSTADDSYALDEFRCREILHDIGWGVLSVVEAPAGNVSPYSIPVAYAYDGEQIYVAVVSGRKQRALEAHGELCLTVLDVDSLDRWRCVVVTGRAVWLREAAARARAIRAFAGQHRPADRQLEQRDVARLLDSALFRIEIRETSGRALGAWESELAAAYAAAERGEPLPAKTALGIASSGPLETGDDATRAMDGLRRIFRALRSAASTAQHDRGVSAAQLFILRQLAAVPGRSLRDLAERTHTRQSSVSEVVARLVSRGLVERRTAAEDHRRAELSLTPAAWTLLAGAPATVQERLLTALSRLTGEQRRALANGIEAWLAAAGLSQVPPTMFFEVAPDGEEGPEGEALVEAPAHAMVEESAAAR